MVSNNDTALEIEAALLIDAYPGLSNEIIGKDAERGAINVLLYN